jgi:hypothetical protein
MNGIHMAGASKGHFPSRYYFVPRSSSIWQVIFLMKSLPGHIITALLLGMGLCQAQQIATNQAPIQSPTPYSIVASDGNSSVWQQTDYQTGANGQTVPVIHQYTELATGLNHLLNGQWVPSSEQIDILPDGTAAATNGQHQVYFPGNIYQGVIELVTPDGEYLNSRPLGLFYDDGTNTVMIAQLTNSVGQLANSNQVVYPNTFSCLNQSHDLVVSTALGCCQAKAQIFTNLYSFSNIDESLPNGEQPTAGFVRQHALWNDIRWWNVQWPHCRWHGVRH